jgi:hypothetical protein
VTMGCGVAMEFPSRNGTGPFNYVHRQKDASA